MAESVTGQGNASLKNPQTDQHEAPHPAAKWAVLLARTRTGKLFYVVDLSKSTTAFTMRQRVLSRTFLVTCLILVIATVLAWIVYGEPTKAWACGAAVALFAIIILCYDAQNRKLVISPADQEQDTAYARPLLGLWLLRRIRIVRSDRSSLAVLKSPNPVPLFGRSTWTVGFGENLARRVLCTPVHAGPLQSLLAFVGLGARRYCCTDHNAHTVAELTTTRAAQGFLFVTIAFDTPPPAGLQDALLVLASLMFKGIERISALTPAQDNESRGTAS